jgi:hypothetical protein
MFGPMGTKSRETIYGSSIRASAERARGARKEADRLACEAWNQRMLGYRGPAQPSPTLGDALNAGFLYLEVRCLGCDTHQKPLPWKSCDDQSLRRSMNWNAICGARNAPRYVAIRTSEVIW